MYKEATKWDKEKVLYIPRGDGMLIDAKTGLEVGDWAGSPKSPNDGAKYVPDYHEPMSPHRRKKLERFFGGTMND